MKYLLLLLMMPSISWASLPTDVHRICSAVKWFGGATYCESDSSTKHLTVEGIEVSEKICNKFTYMVSMNTIEFKNKGWILYLKNKGIQVSCPLY